MNTLTLSKQLLWKDYRQLLPAIVGCWAIMAAILLLTCVRQMLARGSESILPDAIMLVLASPTLAAMAASGILIGHERQSRTWNWSSSLPIPWASSLLSKSIVWLVSSAAMVFTLYILFLGLMQLCRMQGFTRDAMPDWITGQMVVMTVLVVPLIVYVCFSLAALLWNDTLTAFVVAGIVVAIVFLLTSDLFPRWLLGIGVNRSGDLSGQVLGIVLTIVVLVVLTGVFTVRAYQWRWTSGQLASIGWAQRISAPVSSAQRRVIWKSVAWSGGAIGEFRMLLAHAFTSLLGTRLLILASTIGLAAFFGWNDHRAGQAGQALFVTLLGATAMGVTVFAGDQAQLAYRFFADRGVSWYKLLLAHALPPLALALVPVVLVATINARTLEVYEFLAIVGAAIGMFTVAMFCSLCSRLSLLSICMTVGAIMLVMGAMGMLQSFWYYTLGGTVPNAVSVLLIITSLTVLMISTVRLIRNWLIYDRIWGAAYYLSTLVLAIVPSHLLAVCLCFLNIPNVPWQGLPEGELLRTSQLPRVEINKLPISINYGLYSYDPERINDAVEYGYTVLRANLWHDSASPASKAADEKIDTVRKSLKEMEATLDRLENGPRVTVEPIVLYGQIEATAWLAAYATQKLRDLELARTAWKVNRQLLSLVDYEVQDGYGGAISSRLLSVQLRAQLKADDWEFLKTGGSLSELQPAPVSRELWIRDARRRATVFREMVRNEPYGKILLPLRWYQERKLAFLLQQQIQIISGVPVSTHPTVRELAFFQNQPVAVMLRGEARLPK